MAHSAQLVKKAHDLRRVGDSLISISRKLGISKSTASEWCRNVELPNDIKSKMHDRWESGFKKGIEVMRIRRENAEEKRVEIANTLLQNRDISKNKELLKIYAALLYWCEGSKQPFTSVVFTNSDPSLVSAFLYCLRKGFNLFEEKFRVHLHLHDYHNETEQIKFWSDATHIPSSQFRKTFNKQSNHIRKRDNYPGCISVRYYNSAIAKELRAIYHAFAHFAA